MSHFTAPRTQASNAAAAVAHLRAFEREEQVFTCILAKVRCAAVQLVNSLNPVPYSMQFESRPTCLELGK